MNAMLKVQTICLLLLLGTATMAQKSVTKPLANSADKKVVIVMKSGELIIEGTTGSELVAEALHYQEPPERAKGLKPLSAGGTDNTGIGLEIIESGNTMTIKKVSNQEADFVLKIPKNVNISIEEEGWSNGSFEISGMEGEVEIKGQGSDIDIKNVSGPIVAHTVSGNITIVYSNIKANKPSSISATSGYVDVTLPASAKVDLDLKVISGDIYTDIDLNTPTKNGLKQYGSSNIKASLNGGGTEISLKAISDNIYLRKGK